MYNLDVSLDGGNKIKKITEQVGNSVRKTNYFVRKNTIFDMLNKLRNVSWNNKIGVANFLAGKKNSCSLF